MNARLLKFNLIYKNGARYDKTLERLYGFQFSSVELKKKIANIF